MTAAAAHLAPRDWPKAGDRISVQDFGPFEHEALARYAAVSGDDNPLHLNPDAAKAAGLPGSPVHGMLMLSCFEPWILGWRQDVFIAQLSAKFLRPVFAGEGFCLAGRVLRSQLSPRPQLILRLTAQGPGETLVILAEAVILHKDTNFPGPP